MIDAEQRATMLCQMVARDTEGLDARVTRLFNECIAAVSIEDQRAGFANAVNHEREQGEQPMTRARPTSSKLSLSPKSKPREVRSIRQDLVEWRVMKWCNEIFMFADFG